MAEQGLHHVQIGPARTQSVAAVCRSMWGRTAKPQSRASHSKNRFAAR